MGKKMLIFVVALVFIFGIYYFNWQANRGTDRNLEIIDEENIVDLSLPSDENSDVVAPLDSSDSDDLLLLSDQVNDKDSKLKLSWEIITGDEGDNKGEDIAVDSLGNVYVVGVTSSLIISNETNENIINSSSHFFYNDSTSSLIGDRDLLLLKFDSRGNLLWSKRRGNNDYDFGLGVDTDSVGNVYVVGGTTVLGGSTFLWLMKYDSDGKLLWEKTENRSSYDLGYDVAVAEDGSVYVVGSTGKPGSEDLWLLKYDFDGKKLWDGSAGVDGNDYGMAVSIGPEGYIYVSGITNAHGSEDLWLLKFDSEGNLIWDIVEGGEGFDQGRDIAIAPNGDLYVVGPTSKLREYDDLWLLKYNSEGELIWERVFGEELSENGFGVTVAEDGSVYVVGHHVEYFGFYNGVDYSNQYLTSDMLLLKYDSDGNLLSNILSNKEFNDFGTGITIDSVGNVYVVGSTNPSLTDYADLWLMKFKDN